MLKQARAEGEKESETMEALQQAFRRAKHAAKKQEGQRKKVRFLGSGRVGVGTSLLPRLGQLFVWFLRENVFKLSSDMLDA